MLVVLQVVDEKELIMSEEQKDTQQPSSGGLNVSGDEKTILIVTHLSGIVLGFIVPLVMFLVKADGSEALKASIKEALNFQITMLIFYLIASALCVVIIGLLIMPVVGILNLVFCILAAIAIGNGQDYRYPFAFRLIK